jgi:hypothetical protein
MPFSLLLLAPHAPELTTAGRAMPREFFIAAAASPTRRRGTDRRGAKAPLRRALAKGAHGRFPVIATWAAIIGSMPPPRAAG